MSLLRRFRGAQPLRLMATIVSFAIVAAGVAGWFQAGSDPRGILVWVLACAVAFECILFPLAWALDRLAQLGPHDPSPGGVVRPPRRAVAFIRIPGMLSLLLLVVFAPLIFRADTRSFMATTGLAPANYLVRWLLATAAMYGVSAVWYALTLRRASNGAETISTTSSR
jgi:hypothetical protein